MPVFIIGGAMLLLSDVQTDERESEQKGLWIVLSESITGKSHMASIPPVPCQDSRQVVALNEDSGIVVVADGLGSKPLSHFGSDIAAKKACQYLYEHLKKRGYDANNTINLKEWEEIALGIGYRVYRYMVGYARIHDFHLQDLATTLIMVVYAPWGVLCAHIGDGRAGYRDTQGEWHSMMSPINDEEGAVMPITGNFWLDKNKVKKYVEVQAINKPIEAFVVMSDGCESFSYETVTSQGVVNRPYAPFFDPVVSYIQEQYAEGVNITDIKKEFRTFLQEGNEKIKKEDDDKTMVLGCLKLERVGG